MTKSILSLGLALLLLQGECSAITMPAPPPELPDTLTSFRTKEQINENTRIENELVKEEAQEVALEENPFVPGDDNSGIVRYASVYTPSMAIGIPEYGLSIVPAGVAETLRKVKNEYKYRNQLIETVMALDTRTVPKSI